MTPRFASREKGQAFAAPSEVHTRPAFLAERVAQCRYFFDGDAHAGAKLTLPCGGWERCSSSYAVRRESFQYFALEYVAEGYGFFTCSGQKTELQPGILFGYAPGSPYAISTSAEQPLLKYFLDFSGPQAKRVFRGLPLDGSGTGLPDVLYQLDS